MRHRVLNRPRFRGRDGRAPLTEAPELAELGAIADTPGGQAKQNAPGSVAYLQRGQRVKISGAAGEVIGEVAELETPATLPTVPGFSHPLMANLRAILAEGEVDLVAMLRYTSERGTPLVFAALHSPAGWRDLRGQELTLEPVS